MIPDVPITPICFLLGGKVAGVTPQADWLTELPDAQSLHPYVQELVSLSVPWATAEAGWYPWKQPSCAASQSIAPGPAVPRRVTGPRHFALRRRLAVENERPAPHVARGRGKGNCTEHQFAGSKVAHYVYFSHCTFGTLDSPLF